MKPLALVCLLIVSIPAQAHRLVVFAYAEGLQVQGSVRYAGGGGAAGVAVRIREGESDTTLMLQTDPEGRFHFRARRPVDHRILATSSTGHQARWHLSAEEFSPASVADPPAPAQRASSYFAPVPASENARDEHLELSESQHPPQAPAEYSPPASRAVDAQLEAAIEGAVARQLGPLRAELQQFRHEVRLSDVLGGLGSIFGLAGLYLWWRSRRGEPRR